MGKGGRAAVHSDNNWAISISQIISMLVSSACKTEGSSQSTDGHCSTIQSNVQGEKTSQKLCLQLSHTRNGLRKIFKIPYSPLLHTPACCCRRAKPRICRYVCVPSASCRWCFYLCPSARRSPHHFISSIHTTTRLSSKRSKKSSESNFKDKSKVSILVWTTNGGCTVINNPDPNHQQAITQHFTPTHLIKTNILDFVAATTI